MNLNSLSTGSWDIEKKQGHKGDRIEVFTGCPKPNYLKMSILSLKETIEGS